MEQRLRLLAVAVLLGGLALTAGLLGWLFLAARESERDAFEANVHSARTAVIDRVETALALLRGVAGLVASQGGGEVSPDEYRSYMSKLALREQYPGLLGLGYSLRLPATDVPELEARMRAEGLSDFRVWPAPAGEEAHSILFIEPLDARNAAAIGYDMFSDPVRREAMTRARDSGAAAMSGVVELVQEIESVKQPGFLVYLPVYREGVVPVSIDERRAALLGFSYAPIRAVDFLSRALDNTPLPFADVSVHLGEPRPENLLYRRGDGTARPRFELELRDEIGGQSWTFSFRSTTSQSRAWLVLGLPAAAGVTLSLLLAMLLWREAAARERVHAALAREQSARAQAERANRMKDRFLATLSHELRTPLTAIVGWAAVLSQGALGQARLVDGLDVIDRNARALARLIDDLLDMNRIAAGKVNVRQDAVDLADVLEDAIDAVGAVAAQKGLRMEQQLAPGALQVRGDAARLQQVFWNLLSNAVKFTPEGGSIVISLSGGEGRARVRVSDSGEGIPPDLLERIFDPFAQAEGGGTRRHGGLGLGLAIARQLVELHGGTIKAESAGSGRGATFEVELPLLEQSREEEPRPAPLDQGAALAGLRLLVVDDEPDVRELLGAVLSARGAQVECRPGATEAIEAVQSWRPHVLISDIGMPGRNGLELLRDLRRLPPERGGATPAIALTAYAREEDRQAALAAGYQLHLAKPVRPEQLQVAVRRLAGPDAGARL